MMHNNENYDDELDLKELLTVLWRGKNFIAVLTLFSIFLGSMNLRSSTPQHEISMLLAPVQSEQRSPNLGELAGLASLAAIAIPDGSSSDFNKYELMLVTEEVSREIFKEKNLISEIFSYEWNENENLFQKPEPTRVTEIKGFLKELLTGWPPNDYMEPNPARLSSFIRRNIDVSIDKKTNYIRLSAESADPDMIIKLMRFMIDSTDSLFKKKFIKQADDAIKFYQTKIAKARSLEHREILATLIAQEEKKLLLATRDAPYIAEILTGPNISLYPTSPKIKFILLLSTALGFVFSCSLILIRHFLKG